MAIDNFIPALWSGRLLANLNNAHVFKKCVNHDYEGEIKNFGDTVKINSIGRVSVFDYTKNQDIPNPEVLNGAMQMLRIDQAKAFNFYVDDLDKAQQKPKVMDDAMKEASWSLANECDLFIAHRIWSDPDVTNKLTPDDVGTGASDGNLYEILVELARVLDESNTPPEGRWAMLTPKMLAALRKDPRFASFGTDVNRRVIRGESIGDIAEFQIHISNNCPDGDSPDWGASGFNAGISAGDQVLLAGYKGAVTFADQIVKTESYKPERRFGNAVKGLHVYGGKVVRPSNLAMATFGYAS